MKFSESASASNSNYHMG